MQRFLEVFRGFSKALSETLSECHFLSELRAVLPLIVLPLKTPTTQAVPEGPNLEKNNLALKLQ